MATQAQIKEKDKTLEAIGKDVLAQYDDLDPKAPISDIMEQHTRVNAKNMLTMLHASSGYAKTQEPKKHRRPLAPTPTKQTQKTVFHVGNVK